MDTTYKFPRSVFLTGATGVLGGRILTDLLQSTTARIYCLARGDHPAHCRQRVWSLQRVYGADAKLESEFRARVTVLDGDVRQERLGLPCDPYEALQNDTELTIHAAANTSLLAKNHRLEPINVQGTARVIDFCLGTRGKNLSYVSTYTVMGDKTFDQKVRFRETDYDLGQGFAHMNYQHTKFRAEAMVRAAREQGLKWRIFRPGQIYGDSVTGAYPHAATRVSGLFYDLFRTAMDTGVMPEAYLHYDVVPVDYVSRGIVALVLLAAILLVVGLIATLAGGFAGGYVARRYSLVTSLWIGGVVQAVANLSFSWLALIGPYKWGLALAITTENFTSAIGTVIFVAYLSALCRNPLHTATQYALLTALAAVGRTYLSAGAGYVAKASGWPMFFVICMLVAIPSLMLLAWLQRRGHFETLDK